MKNFLSLSALLAGGALLSAGAGAAPAAATVAAAPGATLQFLACPVYRDTDAGRKSGCWIATDGSTGRRYDVSDSPSKPLLGRQILIEGVASGEADICGGAVLNPVRISVLPDACPEVMIPAEGYPSKPSVLPKDIMQPTGVPRTLPVAPFSRQEYHVIFDFGADRLIYQSVETTLERAMLYAQASKSTRVSITAYADVRGITIGGRKLAEDAALARARETMVVKALAGLGVPESVMVVTTGRDPKPLPSQPGMQDASRRRVTIVVEPGAAVR